MALPPDIFVEDLQPEGRRYALPRRDWKSLRWGSIALLGFTAIEILFLLGFLRGMIDAFSGGPPWMAIIVGIFIAPMFIPLAIALGAMFGHSEIEIHADTLRTIERVGLLRWMRTRRLDQVRRLHVESARLREKKQPGGLADDGALSAVRIEWGGTRPWFAAVGYPRAMLLPLAVELAERCRVGPVGLGFADDPQSLPPIEVVDGPTDDDIAVRHEQPSDSKIIVNQQPGSVTYNVPAAGVVRGSSGLFFFACIWCAFMALVTGLVFVAGGPPQQGLGASLGALAFIGLFWLVGIGMLIAAVSAGVRRAGIAVAGDRLSILKTGLFKSKSHTWSRDEIMSVRVGPSGVEVNDRPVLELQVLPRDGVKFGLLGGRDVKELAWLATSIREALGLAISSKVSDDTILLPDVAKQPEKSQVAVTQVPGGLTFSVPPLGIGRSTIGIWIFAVAWIAGVGLFGFFILREKGHWLDRLFPLAIATFMEATGIALLGVALHWSIRRAEIAVAGGSLLILQTGLTGKKHYEWRRDELLAIRAGASGNTSNGKPMIELQIVPHAGKQVGFLLGREDSELAWIATLLRNALELPAEVEEPAISESDPITEEANT